MKKSMSRVVAVGLVGFLAGPVVGQNLLLNPGFEDDILPGPPDDWPDYWSETALEGAEGVEWIGAGWHQDAGPHDGLKAVGAGSNYGINAGYVEQSIGLPNGPGWYDLTLSFYAWVYDTAGAPSWVRGEIIADGEAVAEVTLSTDDPGDQQIYVFMEVSWAGVATTDLTVRITLRADGEDWDQGGNAWGVVCADDVSLTQAPDCGTQHELTGIAPDAHDNNSDTSATISGSNLDYVTAVKLVMGETEIEGTDLTPGGGGSTLAVDFPTTGAESGIYHLAAEQSGCPSRALVDAFEVTCPDPTVLTEATPHVLTIPPLVKTMTIDGTANLDQLVAVWLVHENGSPSVQGDITTQTATQVIAEFDLSSLSGADIGLYDVVGERIDGCPDAVLEDEVEVVVSTTNPNLLLEPSFEVGDNQGNAEIWFGDYTKSLTHIPSPAYIEGTDRWGVGSGGYGLLETVTWQSVPAPAEGVVFTGYVSVGPGAEAENSARIAIYDGPSDPANEMDFAVVDKETERTVGTWAYVVLIGTPISGAVTVEVKCSLLPNGFEHESVAAVHLDAFALYASSPCGTQHALDDPGEPPSNPNPNQGPQNADTTVTITGTDLHLVDGAKLISVKAEAVLEGTIDAQTATALTVTFPTSSAPIIGLYNVVTEQTTCVSQVIVDGFEVYCADPSGFVSLDPSELQAPQYEVQFTITGDHLDQLSTVSLVQAGSGTTIPGTIDDNSGPNAILATFDLFGQPNGYYNLVGTRDDACDDPADLAGAFNLLPAARENVLLNSSFEDDDVSGPPPHQDPWPDHWVASGAWEPVWIETGWYWGAGPHTGDKGVGAADMGSLKTETVEQSVGLPMGAGTYDLELTFWAWLYDDSAYESSVVGEIFVDGNPTPVASGRLSNAAQGETEYTLVTVPWAGTADTDITVRITLNADGRGVWGVAAVDDVQLGIPVVLLCNDPFADVDGDHDIDQEDFGLWQVCRTGANQGPIPAEPDYCRCLDVEGSGGFPDNDIDEQDWAEFEKCATGPEITVDPEDPDTWPPECLVSP